MTSKSSIFLEYNLFALKSSSPTNECRFEKIEGMQYTKQSAVLIRYVHMDSFPILYMDALNEKMRFWSISVEDQGDKSLMTTEYGIQGVEPTKKVIVITEGKNIGKKNETTHYQQAMKQARSEWKKKRNQGYGPEEEDEALKEDEEDIKEEAPMEDRYTMDILRDEFRTHKQYVLQRMKTRDATGINIRMPNMPEDISENIVKFIIHNYVGDRTSIWTKGLKGKKRAGDLFSAIEGTQEIKCFTSDGPPTFGPTESWDVIYFLDARDWINEHFVLWRIPLTNASVDWKSIKMNKNKTYEDQSIMGRRPRISWKSLLPQVEEHAVEVFNGTFDEIFREPHVSLPSTEIKAMEPVDPQ